MGTCLVGKQVVTHRGLIHGISPSLEAPRTLRGLPTRERQKKGPTDSKRQTGDRNRQELTSWIRRSGLGRAPRRSSANGPPGAPWGLFIRQPPAPSPGLPRGRSQAPPRARLCARAAPPGRPSAKRTARDRAKLGSPGRCGERGSDGVPGEHGGDSVRWQGLGLRVPLQARFSPLSNGRSELCPIDLIELSTPQF